jgi:hypothetical protein
VVIALLASMGRDLLAGRVGVDAGRLCLHGRRTRAPQRRAAIGGRVGLPQPARTCDSP